MTAVANPPSFQQINRATWGTNGGQGGLNSLNDDEVARMFMPRKSAQRANSSSSISSNSSVNSSSSSSTATMTQPTPQTNGISIPPSNDGGVWNAAAARKKPAETSPAELTGVGQIFAGDARPLINLPNARTGAGRFYPFLCTVRLPGAGRGRRGEPPRRMA